MRRVMLYLTVMSLILVGCGQFPESDINPYDLADANGRFVDLDGSEIYYQSWGHSENPAVILVHGFGGSTIGWRLNAPDLAEAGYYVVALDRPGFGLSDKSPDIDYTHAAQADVIAALMDELNIETATIVGHSQGGNVVAHFAVEHPDRLDKLVIVAGAIVPSEESGADFGAIADLALEPSELLRDVAENPLLSRIMAFILGSYFTEERIGDLMLSAYGDIEHDEALVALYYRPFLTPGWEEGLIAMTLDSEGNILSQDQLAQIEASTLIMWGTTDAWVPIEGGYVLDEIIPNSRMVTYPDIGHSPMDTVPDVFTADLLEFLGE